MENKKKNEKKSFSFEPLKKIIKEELFYREFFCKLNNKKTDYSTPNGEKDKSNDES
jgi:hypothetical protein